MLLLTPPMVQLNTPYPAVPVLAGFLKSRGVAVRQADLSLEVALRLFTPAVVREAAEALKRRHRLPDAARAFRERAAEYEANVAPAVAFLQGRAPELAWRFSRPGSLPAGPHFRELDPDGTGDPEAGLDAIYGPQAIADRAGDGFEVSGPWKAGFGGGRVAYSVKTATDEARMAESQEQALSRAVHG